MSEDIDSRAVLGSADPFDNRYTMLTNAMTKRSVFVSYSLGGFKGCINLLANLIDRLNRLKLPVYSPDKIDGSRPGGLKHFGISQNGVCKFINEIAGCSQSRQVHPETCRSPY